jgi:hypothetical protein
LHTAAHRVDDHRVLAGLRQHRLLRLVGFTHRVSVPNSPNPAPALKKTAAAQAQLQDLGSSQQASSKPGAGH